MIVTLIIFIVLLTIGMLYWFVQDSVHCYEDDDGIYHIWTEKCVWIAEGLFLFLMICTIIVNCISTLLPMPLLCEWGSILNPTWDMIWIAMTGGILAILVVSHIICVFRCYSKYILN